MRAAASGGGVLAQVERGPEKADELAGNGADHFGGGLAARDQPRVAPAEPVLRLVGEGHGPARLGRAARADLRTHPGRNTQPVRAPVNASPPPSRAAAHDSGSERIATPSLCGPFIHDPSPVCTGARTVLSATRRLLHELLHPGAPGQAQPHGAAFTLD